MDSEERVMIKELFHNLYGVELYWFHEYKKLSVAQIYKSVNHLLEEKFIIKDKYNIRLDKRRLKTIMTMCPEIFCDITKDWKNNIDLSSKISNNLREELKKFR